jgi:hypothetical protein
MFGNITGLNKKTETLTTKKRDNDSMMSKKELLEDTIVHPTIQYDFLLEDSSLSNNNSNDIIDTTTALAFCGSCCSSTIGDLRRTKNPIEKFQKFIRSDALEKFTKASGVEFTRFEEPDSWCDKQFQEVLKNKDVDESQKVCVVFHGTSSKNISSILQDGLDPEKRTGQAYGKGEYFSMEPSVCFSYCKNDKATIVFLVIMPLPLTSKTTGQNIHIPYDFVIVEETRHQFPLGVLHFSNVDSAAPVRSQNIRSKMNTAKQNLHQQVTATHEVQWKALIIQLLIQSKIDLAVEKYERFHKRLSNEYKREISMYVHQVIDEDVIPCLFPDLPKPFDNIEFEQNTSGEVKTVIRSLEWHTRQAKKAKVELAQVQDGI